MPWVVANCLAVSIFRLETAASSVREANFIVRAIMKRIARKAGAPTDTSRNYEFTNWTAVDRLAGELARPDR